MQNSPLTGPLTAKSPFDLPQSPLKRSNFIWSVTYQGQVCLRSRLETLKARVSDSSRTSPAFGISTGLAGRPIFAPVQALSLAVSDWSRLRAALPRIWGSVDVSQPQTNNFISQYKQKSSIKNRPFLTGWYSVLSEGWRGRCHVNIPPYLWYLTLASSICLFVLIAELGGRMLNEMWLFRLHAWDPSEVKYLSVCR